MIFLMYAMVVWTSFINQFMRWPLDFGRNDIITFCCLKHIMIAVNFILKYEHYNNCHCIIA